MNNTSLPTLNTDFSDRSTRHDTLNLDTTPIPRRNVRFEKMRSSLKNSLFHPEKHHSLTVIPLSNHSVAFDDGGTTPTSENLERSRDSVSGLPNSKMEKYRKLVKGNLFPQHSTKTNISIDINELNDDSYLSIAKPHSITSLGVTPTNFNLDDCNNDNLGFGSYIERERLLSIHKVEESKHEDSMSIENHSGYHNSRIYESPTHDSEHRHSVFLRDIHSEVEEIKRDLDVENEPNIQFIKGNFWEYYTEEAVLGEGTTGIVKKGIKKETGESFAVKIVHYRDDLEILILIVKEFQNHRRLNHKNIIKVYELYIDYFTKKIYTVMELANCKEMFCVLHDLGHYSEAVASGIFKQILTSINYLHQNGVCHRDLKPNNILVSDDGKTVKITDFNVSKFVQDKKKKYSSLSTENYKMWTYTGTPAFTAPEVFIESEYTEAVDMWSAGAVLYTMLCGYQPFQAEYVHELIDKIKTGQYEFHSDPWDKISKQAKKLVKHCLDINPKTRYSPSAALMDPWIVNCGKLPTVDIPRTGYYFKTLYKKRILRKNRAVENKNSRNNSVRRGKPNKPEDNSLQKPQNLSPPVEESEEHHTDTQSNESKENIINLQPKRGKTGPEGAEGFRPLFLFRLEKSLSFTALEDPKGPNDTEKFTEDEENDEEDDDDIHEIDENLGYYLKVGASSHRPGANPSKFYKESKDKDIKLNLKEGIEADSAEDQQKKHSLNGKKGEVEPKIIWKNQENKENFYDNEEEIKFRENRLCVEPLQIQK